MFFIVITKKDGTVEVYDTSIEEVDEERYSIIKFILKEPITVEDGDTLHIEQYPDLTDLIK